MSTVKLNYNQVHEITPKRPVIFTRQKISKGFFGDEILVQSYLLGFAPCQRNHFRLKSFPNPDPISDQKCQFANTHPFQTWPLRNYVRLLLILEHQKTIL